MQQCYAETRADVLSSTWGPRANVRGIYNFLLVQVFETLKFRRLLLIAHDGRSLRIECSNLLLKIPMCFMFHRQKVMRKTDLRVGVPLRLALVMLVSHIASVPPLRVLKDMYRILKAMNVLY